MTITIATRRRCICIDIVRNYYNNEGRDELVAYSINPYPLRILIIGSLVAAVRRLYLSKSSATTVHTRVPDVNVYFKFTLISRLR